MRTSIHKLPRCRWCDKEPEFSSEVGALLSVCGHCGAMQSPIIHLAAPGGRPVINFFINPDDGIFMEIEKAGSPETVRYSLSAAQLQKAGVPVLKSPFPLNGKAVDRGLSAPSP